MGGRCCQWGWRRVCVRYCHTPLHRGRFGRNDGEGGESNEDSGSQGS